MPESLEDLRLRVFEIRMSNFLDKMGEGSCSFALRSNQSLNSSRTRPDCLLRVAQQHVSKKYC